MDIKKFAVEPTSVLHLCDAKEDPMYAEDAEGKADLSKPITVKLYGPGSKQYARAMSRQNNRIVDKLKRKGKADQSAEQRAEEQAEFLAACTVGFENLEYDQLQGDALAKAVYSDPSLGFIPDQVSKHIGEWSNFSKVSTKGSPSSSGNQPG